MDTISVEVSPLAGFARPIDQARIWLNGVELAPRHDRFGPEPSVLAAAASEARRTGVSVDAIVALCSVCLDEGCGYTVADILHTEQTVTWTLFEVWTDDEEHRDIVGTFTFDSLAYDDALSTLGIGA